MEKKKKKIQSNPARKAKVWVEIRVVWRPLVDLGPEILWSPEQAWTLWSPFVAEYPAPSRRVATTLFPINNWRGIDYRIGNFTAVRIEFTQLSRSKLRRI